MSDVLTCPASPQDALPARVERQWAMLGRLAEAGLAIIDAIEHEATAPDRTSASESRADLALAYGRVSRAVRLSLLLQSKLEKDARFEDRAAETRLRFDEAQAADAREDLEIERKARVERIVERVAQAEHADAETVERLVDQACERMDGDDIYGDILTRPLSDIVAEICRDLGLSPDWPVLMQEAWAKEEGPPPLPLEGGGAGEGVSAGPSSEERQRRPASRAPPEIAARAPPSPPFPP